MPSIPAAPATPIAIPAVAAGAPAWEVEEPAAVAPEPEAEDAGEAEEPEEPPEETWEDPEVFEGMDEAPDVVAEFPEAAVAVSPTADKISVCKLPGRVENQAGGPEAKSAAAADGSAIYSEITLAGIAAIISD